MAAMVKLVTTILIIRVGLYVKCLLFLFDLDQTFRSFAKGSKKVLCYQPNKIAF
jgi:hypothetical protein